MLDCVWQCVCPWCSVRVCLFLFDCSSQRWSVSIAPFGTSECSSEGEIYQYRTHDAHRRTLLPVSTLYSYPSSSFYFHTLFISHTLSLVRVDREYAEWRESDTHEFGHVIPCTNALQFRECVRLVRAAREPCRSDDWEKATCGAPRYSNLAAYTSCRITTSQHSSRTSMQEDSHSLMGCAHLSLWCYAGYANDELWKKYLTPIKKMFWWREKYLQIVIHFQFFPSDPKAMGGIFFHEIAHLLGVPHRVSCYCYSSLLFFSFKQYITTIHMRA